MDNCTVHIKGIEEKFDGQYQIKNDCLEIEIFNYFSSREAFVSVGEEICYKEMAIVDLKNKVFAFSPIFYNIGYTFSYAQYEKYRTNFYFTTSNFENVEMIWGDVEISELTLYHPMLPQCFNNPALQIIHSEKECKYKVIRNSEKKEVGIQINNIDKIEFGGMCTYSEKNNFQSINIEAENYAKIYFLSPINYEEILAYINEFDVFMNVYCPSGLRSYRTNITTKSGVAFKLIHKLLGDDKYCNKGLHKPVKMDFFQYIEKMYKKIDYRTTKDKNQYIPLEFKKPVSLEDQYIFYFRYIDLYMGKYLRIKLEKEPSNYDRLSTFVDENLYCFKDIDVMNIDNLKHELNSLRNQYIHEGYYLSNDQFAVYEKKKFLYYKPMDYMWLSRIVKTFKYGVYRILYTEVLGLDIDEVELKTALNCWN